MKRSGVFSIIIALVLLGVFGTAEADDKYPSRPIELVVPMGPGGASSTATRAYSEDLSKLLKVPCLVVNREGGIGVTGTVYVIKAKKDGYTLLSTTDTSLVIVPVISKEVTYDPLKDLVPIAYFGHAPSIFAVRRDSPFKTLSELVEYARNNPGKLKNAVAGIGSESYYNLQLLCSKEKIKIGTIPFKSGSEAMTNLLGGHTDMASSSLASLSPQLKAGTLRGLAISSKKRHPDFSTIPTTAELGYPEVDFVIWYALFAPAGVPSQVTNVLIPSMAKVLKIPEVMQRMAQVGMEVEYKGPEEIRKLIESGMQMVKKVLKEGDLPAK